MKNRFLHCVENKGYEASCINSECGRNMEVYEAGLIEKLKIGGDE